MEKLMRAPYTQLYLHCVWTTFKRQPLIRPELEERLYDAIASKCRGLNCHVLAIGGDADHVHLFVRFPTALSVAKLLQEVKGSSSHMMNHVIQPTAAFQWQGGYGVFTVSKRSASNVIDYVHNQKVHHANRHLINELEICEVETEDG
jgi:putative transposase